LSRRMTAVAAAELGPSLDAGEFALQMLQFPYRTVFADRTLTGYRATPNGLEVRAA